ncbi:MAG: DUF2147 domain-containing protein [Sulfitobacter sp.]
MSKFTTFAIITVLSVGAASLARADVPLGLWKSSPDATGLVVHVRTKPCGRALCGRIERAKDRRGYDTPSTAVGRKMLWDMTAQPDGSYAGKIWEPVKNRMLTARMQVEGNTMRLHNCDDAACQDVVWTRLR